MGTVPEESIEGNCRICLAVSVFLWAVVCGAAEDTGLAPGPLLASYRSSLPARAEYILSEKEHGPLARFTVEADRQKAIISMNGHPLLFLNGLDTVDMVNLTRFDGKKVQEQIGLFSIVFEKKFREEFGIESGIPAHIFNVYGLALPLVKERQVPAVVLLPAGTEPSGATEQSNRLLVAPLWAFAQVQGKKGDPGGTAILDTGAGVTARLGPDGWLLDFSGPAGEDSVSVNRKSLKKAAGFEDAEALARSVLFAENLDVSEPERVEVTALALAMHAAVSAFQGRGTEVPERLEKVKTVSRAAFEAILAEYSVDSAAVQASAIAVQFLKEKAPSLHKKNQQTVRRMLEKLISTSVNTLGRELSVSILAVGEHLRSMRQTVPRRNADGALLQAALEGFAQAFAATTGDRIGKAVRWRLRDFIRTRDNPPGDDGRER